MRRPCFTQVAEPMLHRAAWPLWLGLLAAAAVLAITLGGCESYATRMAREQDRACVQDWGLLPGTPAYGQCKVIIAAQQQQEQANWNAAWANAGQQMQAMQQLQMLQQQQQSIVPFSCQTSGSLTQCR